MDEDKPPTEDLDSTETARPQSPILPERIGPYRLLQKIGEGDMGVVWRADDTVLNRTVAIKVLPADVSRDEKRREMFLQEAQLASQVSDAHIVQVYEFGQEGDVGLTSVLERR